MIGLQIIIVHWNSNINNEDGGDDNDNDDGNDDNGEGSLGSRIKNIFCCNLTMRDSIERGTNLRAAARQFDRFCQSLHRSAAFVC